MLETIVSARRLLPLVCACAAFTAVLPSALADVAPPSTSTSAQSAPKRPPLQGGAQVVVLTLSDLRDVGTDLRHLEAAASHLYDEVTIQQVTLQMQPEFIGPGNIISIPVGTIPTGNIIPAKPKRVEAAMAEVKPIATLLKDDVDSFLTGEKQLQMPGNTEEELNGQLQQWAVSVNNIYAQMQMLEPLTQASPYNQPAIAQAAWAMVQDVKQLDKLRRTMYKALQREGKREAQAGGKKRRW